MTIRSILTSLFLAAGAALTALTTTLQDPAAMAATVPPPPKIVPFLWFDRDAEAAIRFYEGIFPDTKVLEQSRWGDGGPVPKGTLMTARVQIAGQQLLLLNGGPLYRFNEAVSFLIYCDSQAEIDALWTKLTADGGEPGHCGWLKDKFGLSWQVIPRELVTLLSNKDAAKAGRVGAALQRMGKLDLAALRAAHAGG